jgi:hypothetical protein
MWNYSTTFRLAGLRIAASVVSVIVDEKIKKKKDIEYRKWLLGQLKSKDAKLVEQAMILYKEYVK